MDPILIAGVLVTLAVVLYVVQPLLTGESARMGRSEDEITEVEARKRTALLALRDAEYDRATGKLDAGDYEKLRAVLSVEALAALDAAREAEEGGAKGSAVREGGAGAGEIEELEALEAEIRTYRAALRDGVLCGECGTPNPGGSRFCAGCGRTLGGADAGT